MKSDKEFVHLTTFWKAGRTIFITIGTWCKSIWLPYDLAKCAASLFYENALMSGGTPINRKDGSANMTSWEMKLMLQLQTTSYSIKISNLLCSRRASYLRERWSVKCSERDFIAISITGEPSTGTSRSTWTRRWRISSSSSTSWTWNHLSANGEILAFSKSIERNCSKSNSYNQSAHSKLVRQKRAQHSWDRKRSP